MGDGKFFDRKGWEFYFQPFLFLKSFWQFYNNNVACQISGVDGGIPYYSRSRIGTIFRNVDIFSLCLMMFLMNIANLKGKFIVLDGPDGCGKSTQTKLLTDFIKKQGGTVILTRDPGGTPIGEQVRRILLDHNSAKMSVRTEVLLYMASRCQLYHECIGPALAAGECVICDRWLSSTLAYQAAAGKIGPQMVLAVAEAALERVWPDLTIIIDLPSGLGLARIGRSLDRMENKSPTYHQQVRQAFLELASQEANFHVVDGAGSVNEVHQQIREVISHYVNP